MVGTFLRLLEGVRTKCVGEPEFFVAATNDFPGLGIVGQDDDPITARTTDFFDYRCD